MSDDAKIDYAIWDWLPQAAIEMEAYVKRLLDESGVKAHDVSARAKSIQSFQRKQEIKQYANPRQQLTDTVAIRIITYSNTDRERACQLLRERFTIKSGEDRNPGDEKPSRFRGYDCQHIVVLGESSAVEGDWLKSGGNLERYFGEFGGLEIQIRTVAGHAWAEFEHARRYKGVQYEAINDQDKETIDQLFGAASDARRALDETFVAIDRILARPSVDCKQEVAAVELRAPGDTGNAATVLDQGSLSDLLENRFPNDKEASEMGVGFGLELARLCDLQTVESLESALEVVDSEQVRALMDISGPVTRVRRFDDELLSRFGEKYIHLTGAAGSVGTRRQQLEWRFDRLRGKTPYRAYMIHGSDCPEGLTLGAHTAAGAVRELAILVARKAGAEAAAGVEGISLDDDLPKSARAKVVSVGPGESIWVTTNLNRDSSERLMQALLELVPGLDIQVVRDDTLVAGNVAPGGIRHHASSGVI